MPHVELPSPLRELAGGIARVTVAGDTVAAALDDLVERHPTLRRHLFDEQGRLRGFVNVFVGESDVNALDGMASPIQEADILTIVPSVAGGRQPEDTPVPSGTERLRWVARSKNTVGGGDAWADPAQTLQEYTPVQLQQRLETGEPLQLIDVRETFEWDIVNLGAHGAKLIPLGDLPTRVEEIDPDTDLVLYCRSGARSAGAARHLMARGFTRVWNLKGGIHAWAEQIDPSMPTY